MNDQRRTKQQLLAELEQLRRRVAELETASSGGDTAKERRQPGDGSDQAGDFTGLSEVEQERDRLGTILTAAVECLPFSFWALGSDGRYVLENAASRELWGEILGQNPAQVARDEKRLSTWLENHRRAWTGEKVENEAEFVVSGEPRSFHNVIAPIRMGEQIIGILGFNMDVTRRKRAETALRESEKRFQAFVDNAPGVAWIKDEQGHYVYANKAYETLLGVPREELLGKTDFDLWPPELAAQFREHDLEVLTSGQVLRTTEETKRADGATSHWWSVKFPFRYTGGKACVGGIAADITARKRAEEALQKAHDELEEKVALRTAELAIFHRFAESASQGFGMADLDGRIAYVNPTMCRLIGEANPEDAIGRPMWSYYLDGVNERRTKEILPALERDGFWEGELPMRSRQGTLAPPLHHVFLLRDTEGRPFRRCAIVTDMTERKQAEEALYQSQATLDAFFRASTAILNIVDDEFRYLKTDEVTPTYFGLDSQSIVGKSIAELAPQFIEEFGPIFRRVIDTGESVHNIEVKSTVPERPGEIICWRVSYFPVALPEGKRGYGVVGTEVTDMKRAEEALRLSEAKYRTLVEASPDGVIMTDLSGHITFASRRVLELYGTDRAADLLGKDALEFVASADHQRFAANVQRTVQEGITRNIEYSLLRKNGTSFAGEISAAVVGDASERPMALVAILKDVTQRRLAEEAVERERQSLWRMLQASDHERQTISYEIHDGLAQYLAAAGMQFQRYDALRDNSPDKAQKAHETAVELVRQSYLEARRLISEVRPPIIDEIGLESAISHLVHEQRQRGGPRIRFESNVRFGRLTPILENALYRIAQEALTNACKHSQSKKVKVSLSQEGQEAWLKVQDWGVGFDPESVDTGHFGLEGIRQRVRLLGGRLTIESASGTGTLLQVVAPILERRIEE